MLRSLEPNISKEGTGSTFSAINRQFLEDLEIPLPPLPEQRRIVAKIEELFSELDKGIESLKTAQEQLKVYRQALLKQAFEGKLTEKWRDENNVGAGSKLALGANVKSGRVTDSAPMKRRKDLPPLTAEELAELPELPLGWGWVKLRLVSDISGGLTKNQKRNSLPNKLPFLRVANVYFNKLELDELHEIGLNDTELDRVLLQRNDLLIVEGNGSVEQIGRVAIWNGIIPNCVHQNHLIKARPHSSANSKYLLYFLMSELGRKLIVRAASSTSGLHTLSISKVEGLFIPLCHIEEQTQVLNELEDKLSAADQLDQTITTALQQAETLRQAILKKAFSGQLVAQDENDEPASMLLERIRTEKSATGGKNKRRKVEKVCVETAPAKDKVIPFPVRIPAISATDLHAGILGLAYRLHEQVPEKLAHFGHVKAEKISHLVEAHLGIDLERMPFKDAAGPNDYPHLKKVESRARKANWFEVHQQASGAYVFKRKPGFDGLLEKTYTALVGRLAEVDWLLRLLLPLNTRQAEIVATLYAAWNNLLLQGCSPLDEEIVFEARENWHQAKLKIERNKFFKGLEWMRQQGLVPAGKGRLVEAKVSGGHA